MSTHKDDAQELKESEARLKKLHDEYTHTPSQIEGVVEEFMKQYTKQSKDVAIYLTTLLATEQWRLWKEIEGMHKIYDVYDKPHVSLADLQAKLLPDNQEDV